VWFLFLGLGLALLISGGLYLRRRVTQALIYFGVGERRVRILRWLLAWLLFGYPLLIFVGVAVTLISGGATLPRLDGPVPTWLLVYPFFLSLLVMVQALPYLLVLDLIGGVARLRAWRRAARAGDASGAAEVAASPRLTRARFALGLVAVAAFALYTPARIYAERGHVRLRHHTLVASHPGVVTAATCDANASPPPFRIAFVADVQEDAHTGPAVVRRVIEQLNTERADVVLSGGDWINSGPDYIEAAAATAGALRSRLGTFSVRGDHEHFAYVDRRRSVAEVERALAAHNVTMLANEVRWFEHHGKRIGVAFLNYNYIDRSDDVAITSLVAQLATADYAIVVSHQFNEHVAALVEGKVDLALSAHTHGGQINPVVGVVHVPLARLETRYVDGRYALGTRTTVITTAGVGYSLVPFRYASPGSLEIVDLCW
jgi:uncharacterized protein